MYINSVLNSFSILQAFLGRERTLTLKAISQAARMPPSKAHRYLHSLISCGMVSQDHESGRYGLGPMAIEYGLAGLAKIDPVRRTCQAAAALTADLDVGAAVSVFSAGGPIFIFYEEPPSDTQYNVRIGTMPAMLSSATGHVFTAFLPGPQMMSHVQATLPPERRRGVDIDGLVHRVRAAGYGTESASYSQSVYGLSAPVFDALGEICAAVTLFSHRSEILDRNSRAIRRLLDETRRLSISGGAALRPPRLSPSVLRTDGRATA